jgi:hypothetical protein
MERITIRIKNKQKAQALINFLKALDFIEEVTAKEISSQPKGSMNEAEFFRLAGLWAGRQITLNAIRQKAWPARS